MTIAVLERPGHGVLWSVTPEELLEEVTSDDESARLAELVGRAAAVRDPS